MSAAEADELARSPDGTYVLTVSQRVAAPIDDVFTFFSDASNLEALTPQTLRFRIVTPGPIEMRTGTLIDYRLRVRGFPVRWRTRIAEFAPNTHFVDEQLRGPYRLWRHEHHFEAIHERCTEVRDRVTFRVPVSWLTGRLVARDVRAIFAHRREQLSLMFPGDDRAEARGGDGKLPPGAR